MSTLYLQVLSTTDHTEPLQGKYQGDYIGLNAKLHSSQIDGNSLIVSESAKGPKGELDREAMQNARLIIAYRHSDTGVLHGTSESLISVNELPWKELPGFDVIEILPKEEIRVKLWNQEFNLEVDTVFRVRFLTTVVFLRNFGVIDQMLWSSEKLEHGPSTLRDELVDKDLSMNAPLRANANFQPT